MAELPEKDKLIERITQEKSIEDVKKNSVVLIGAYSDTSLKTIRECIQTVNPELSPVKADDVNYEYGMTPRQKLHAILSVCNFVIAEDSVPCGEILELEYCRHSGAITAIMHTGQRSTYMTLDCGLHSPDFQAFNYNPKNLDEIKKVIKEIISWVKTVKDNRDNEMKKFGATKLAHSKYCAVDECKERRTHSTM